MHTLKDPQFQNDLQKKLKSISEKAPLNYYQRKKCYSIESPSGQSESETWKDVKYDKTIIFKHAKHQFKFKGLKNTRNWSSSHIRSKNDSFNEEEKASFKSRFDRLESIKDSEEHKYDQITSLETQELLMSKLANLEMYNSGKQSVEHGSDKKPVKPSNCSANFSYSSGMGSSVEKSPSSSHTPVNMVNFQNLSNVNINTSAKSSGIVNCSTEGQEEPLDLQSPETKTCLLQKLYALKEEHQMYESDNSDEQE